MTTVDVSNESELDAAIAEANAATSGSFVIDLTANITETYVLVNSVQLNSGVTLSINDGGYGVTGPYPLAGAIAISSGNTITATGTVPAEETVLFGGSNAVLDIGTPSAFAGTIEGFAPGDVVSVTTAITKATAGTYDAETNTTSLTLTDGITTVATLSLEGNYSANLFTVTSPSAGTYDITPVLPSVPATLSGSTLSGTTLVAQGATVDQTGQVTFGTASGPATVINQGTWELDQQTAGTEGGSTFNPPEYYGPGINGIGGSVSAPGNTSDSVFINEGTLEKLNSWQNPPYTDSGVCEIYVDVIDTGTIEVTDGNSTLQFDGTDNSFSGTYIGGGMIDYGDPLTPYVNSSSTGYSTDYLGTINMTDGACTTSWALVYQGGEITVSDDTTIKNGTNTLYTSTDIPATWDFTTNNGIALDDLPQNSGATFDNYGTLEKTGGSGTTVIACDFYSDDDGSINVETGTLAFDGLSNNFWYISTISGAGTISLGGGGQDAIYSGTFTTAGWTITDAGTVATLYEALTGADSYSGIFTLQSGATLTLDANLTLTGTAYFTNATVNGSDALTTDGPTSVTGAVTFASGVTLAGTGLVSIGSSSTLNALGTVASGTAIAFVGTDGLLDIGTASHFSGTIEDFASGDTLAVSTTITTATPGTFASGKTPLILKDGGTTVATLSLEGNYQGDAFTVTPNAGSYDITPTPCYCRGTLIRTESGEVPVEALAVGSKVLTKSGKQRPIKWIGQRSYGGRFIMGRKDVLPICIKADALDDRVPQRDLWLSPHHALYLDGMLIEAKDLVNGVSIVQADRVERVEYFHIELETHDVIIAEGALAESFIDDDSRSMFSNVQEYRQLYGDVVTGFAQFCAPRREDGYLVEAVRQRIALRARARSEADEPRLGGLWGFVDRVSGGSIEGWAQNVEHPEAPVCLDIYTSGRLIGQVLANRYREDLAKARLGSGRHSFVFTPPRGLIIDSDTVEVRRSLDAAALPGMRFPRRAAA